MSGLNFIDHIFTLDEMWNFVNQWQTRIDIRWPFVQHLHIQSEEIMSQNSLGIGKYENTQRLVVKRESVCVSV